VEPEYLRAEVENFQMDTPENDSNAIPHARLDEPAEVKRAWNGTLLRLQSGDCPKSILRICVVIEDREIFIECAACLAGVASLPLPEVPGLL
jgi:hypothetical protein